MMNYFIIEEGKKYILSSINDLNEWKDIHTNKLENHTKKDVTKELNQLMEKYDIYSNVNFFDVEIEQEGGDEMKVIQLGGN